MWELVEHQLRTKCCGRRRQGGGDKGTGLGLKACFRLDVGGRWLTRGGVHVKELKTNALAFEIPI